jgi:hypothetical protein
MSKDNENDLKLKKMMESAHHDPQLKNRLLKDPESVAKEFGAKITDEDADRLKKLGIFSELADEFKKGSLFRVCDPRICYPSTVWIHYEVREMIKEIIDFNPVFYPVPFRSSVIDRINSRLERNINLRRHSDIIG